MEASGGIMSTSLPSSEKLSSSRRCLVGLSMVEIDPVCFRFPDEFLLERSPFSDSMF